VCSFLNLNSTQNITILSKYIIHDTPTNTLFSLRYGERKSKVKRLLRIILERSELLARRMRGEVGVRIVLDISCAARTMFYQRYNGVQKSAS
jgi:hypothetical protein